MATVPVLQTGAPPVEGFSSPTWAAVLVVGRWLRLFDHGAWGGTADVVLFPKLAALVFCIGTFSAMYAVAAKVSRRPVLVTVVAGTATGLVPSFAIWITSGLENGLFACVVTALGAVLARAAVTARLTTAHTAVLAGGLAALASLTRPDGIVYAAAFPLAAFLVAGRHPQRRTAIACLISTGLVRRSLRRVHDLAADHLRRLPAEHRQSQGATASGSGRLGSPRGTDRLHRLVRRTALRRADRACAGTRRTHRQSWSRFCWCR